VAEPDDGFIPLLTLMVDEESGESDLVADSKILRRHHRLGGGNVRREISDVEV